MKAPPVKPHFFKPLLPGFKNSLKIPDGFLKYLIGHEEQGHVILKKAGKKWVVKLNGQKLEEGWGQFVEEHDLQLGDMLVFRHDGDLQFDVSVFNLSHRDTEYAEYLQEEEEPHTVEETSKNFEFKGFLKYLKGYDKHEHVILRRDGKKWLLKLNGHRVEEGWGKFAEDHNVQLGDMLVFRHEGNTEFEVFIFDSTHCDREYAEYIQIQEEDEDEDEDNEEDEDEDEDEIQEGEETSKKFEFNDKPNPCIMSSSRGIYNAEEVSTHCVFTVKPYCLTNGYLRLPKKFVLANGLARTCDLVIRDERQRSWNLRLTTYGSQVYILGGWKEFCVANGLKVGDHRMFEVVTSGEKPIWKFHEYAEYIQIQDEDEDEDEDNEEDEDEDNEEDEDEIHEGGETSKKFEFDDKPNPCIMSSSRGIYDAEEVSTHCVFTVKPYCLTNGYLRLPKKFALANGLARTCDLVIRDDRQRSWNLRLTTYDSQVYILGGWREFCVANGLKVGDHKMFEVVNSGEKPIWKFYDKPSPNIKSSNKSFLYAEAAILKPFGYSHFVCTITSYCLSRDFLHIPKKFAHENDLINKKRELTIRDERQRSWDLRLCYFGNSACIKGGWHEFRDTNCLKEGDRVMFEVVTNGEKPIWQFHGKKKLEKMQASFQGIG